jgi:L-histidine N-alpha-methyltransferase
MRQHADGHDHDFRTAALAGLSRPDKRIPCKYLYDEAGSALFEQICELPEYYLTRTETALLERIAPEIAGLAGAACRVVEFGAGSSRKIRILLSALDVSAYVPVDVSRDYLLQQMQLLSDDFPSLAISPVCADFMREFALPPDDPNRRTLGFFPGSTIGNLVPDDARSFLRRAARLLGPDGLLVVGVDLRKDLDVLHAAYDDAAGVTARFSLNLLARMNRELGAGFNLDDFRHDAEWDEERGCIVIRLLSRRAQAVRVDGRIFTFAEGEAIHVEDSHKYTVPGFHALAAEAGFAPAAVWCDPQGLFSIHCLRPTAD